jgi:hypothetical protein
LARDRFRSQQRCVTVLTDWSESTTCFCSKNRKSFIPLRGKPIQHIPAGCGPLPLRRRCSYNLRNVGSNYGIAPGSHEILGVAFNVASRTLCARFGTRFRSAQIFAFTVLETTAQTLIRSMESHTTFDGSTASRYGTGTARSTASSTSLHHHGRLNHLWWPKCDELISLFLPS